MTQLDELRLIAKIARLYYERNWTQPDIADRLQLSQATVSRMLKRARREGIVRITVTPPSGAYPDMEDCLQQRYNMRDVVVAESEDESEEETIRAIGAAAAYYLETTLEQDEVIGVSSWSSTLGAMVRTLRPLTRQTNATVVQALGGMGNPSAEYHANNLVRQLSHLVNGKPLFLPAPAVVASREMRESFLRDLYVKETISMFDKVTLGLMGVGCLEPSLLLRDSGNTFNPEELESLAANGAVGDICLHFYNAAGDPISSEFDNRVFGMKYDQMRDLKRCIGVAGGKRKVQSIHAAMKGRWINILITDRFTARYLCELPD